MWPFSASNAAVIAEKRAQRSRKLVNVATELIGGEIYLKATGVSRKGQRRIVLSLSGCGNL